MGVGDHLGEFDVGVVGFELSTFKTVEEDLAQDLVVVTVRVQHVAGSCSDYLKSVEGREEIHVRGVFQIVQYKMIEGKQLVGGRKGLVAGLEPAFVVTVVGIGEAEEKLVFSSKMMIEGAAGFAGKLDDLGNRSFVVSLFCEKLPSCIHDILFCVSFAVCRHN